MCLPLLYRISYKYTASNRPLVESILRFIVDETSDNKSKIYSKSLPELLKLVGKSKDEYLDRLLLNTLKITQVALFDIKVYLEMLKDISSKSNNIEITVKKYVEKSVASTVGRIKQLQL